MFTKHNSGKSLEFPPPHPAPKTVNRARRAVKVRTDSKDTRSLAPHAESLSNSNPKNPAGNESVRSPFETRKTRAKPLKRASEWHKRNGHREQV